MLRRIKPKAIICYGEPFVEMEGKLIVVDYAKTNNLSSEKQLGKPITKYIQGFILKGGGAPAVVGAVSELSPNFPAGIPQNVPGKVMSGAAEASLDPVEEAGTTLKQRSSYFRT